VFFIFFLQKFSRFENIIFQTHKKLKKDFLGVKITFGMSYPAELL